MDMKHQQRSELVGIRKRACESSVGKEVISERHSGVLPAVGVSSASFFNGGRSLHFAPICNTPLRDRKRSSFQGSVLR